MIQRLGLTICCVGALIFCMKPAFVAAAVDEENLLRNSGFEEGVSDTGVPLGWRLYGRQDELRALSLVDLPEGGGRALLIADKHPDEELGIVQRVPATPGTPYVAEVSAMQVENASPAGAYLQLRFLPSDEYFQRPLIPGPPGSFNRVEVGLVAPPGTREAAVYLYTHRSPIPQVLVGDVMLRAVAELPPGMGLHNAPQVPEIEALKPLYLETAVAAGGHAAALIVAPPAYAEQAAVVKAAIQASTGAELPVLSDDAVGLPFAQNIIALGNRSTNRFIGLLYDRFYTLLDLRYPGPGGYVVRSLHNPMGDGHNVILLGGSDLAGVSKATAAFCAAGLGKAAPGRRLNCRG
ncbi:MAG: hypothetical protein ACOX5J_04100 [Candidatus Hydrogenedentales bacterium]